MSDTKSIHIKVVGDEVNLNSLQAKLQKSHNTTLHKGVLQVDHVGSVAFVFAWGAVVVWGMRFEDKTQLMDRIQSTTSGTLLHENWDSFEYSHQDDVSNHAVKHDINIKHDVVCLSDGNQDIKLAISHALAQSACLELFEDKAQKTITDNAGITDKLAKTGKIPLKRNAIAKLRGTLFKTRSDILSRYNLLDTPEFFWEFPEYQDVYQKMAGYLELQQRVHLLTLKLTSIQDLLDMLASEQNHQHSAFLEWIIIALIAVDIVLYFGH